MKTSRALNLALVPIGAAIVARGLQFLTDEADQLGHLIAERRGQLAGDDEDQGAAPAPAPQDFPPAPSSSTPSTGNSPVRRVRRAGWMLAGAAVAFVAGAAVAARMLPMATRLEAMAAPCVICMQPVRLVDAYPGHVCPDCWLSGALAERDGRIDEAAPGPWGREDVEHAKHAHRETYPDHTHQYGKGTCRICGADGVAFGVLVDELAAGDVDQAAAGEPLPADDAGAEPAGEPDALYPGERR